MERSYYYNYHPCLFHKEKHMQCIYKSDRKSCYFLRRLWILPEVPDCWVVTLVTVSSGLCEMLFRDQWRAVRRLTNVLWGDQKQIGSEWQRLTSVMCTTVHYFSKAKQPLHNSAGMHYVASVYPRPALQIHQTWILQVCEGFESVRVKDTGCVAFTGREQLNFPSRIFKRTATSTWFLMDLLRNDEGLCI